MSNEGERLNLRNGNSSIEDEEESDLILSDEDDCDSSESAMDFDDEYSALREEAINAIVADTQMDEEFPEPDNTTTEGSGGFPHDFMVVFQRLIKPKTVGDVVSLSDSDQELEGPFDSNSPQCNVPSCKSRKSVRTRSRLITSYYGLSYLESPVFCRRCFIKAAKFYKKIAQITPDKCKFLVNNYISKADDCIDMCEDGPTAPSSSEILDDNGVATDVCRNISIHVDNVAVRYNILDKYNKAIKKMEDKIGKMTIWINELNCKMDMDDQSLVSALQDVYRSHELPLKPLAEVDLDPVDADNPETNGSREPTVLSNRLKSIVETDQHPDKNTIVIDSISDSDIAYVDDMVEVPVKPNDLPPRGIIKRIPPSINQKVFVSRELARGETDWVPAVIESIIIDDDNGKKIRYKYRVRVGNVPIQDYVKEVYEEQMAYFDVPDVRIPVGTRVLSAYKPNNESEPEAFYAGIVAERPSSNNQFRYMIMFNSMKVQYSYHSDLRITCHVKENIYEYFPESYRGFIRKYFEMLPKRKILTFNTMDVVKVEFQGQWTDAQVVAIDGLLVKVFYKTSEAVESLNKSNSAPVEWLYRGSPRIMLKDMYRSKLIRTVKEGTIKQTSRGGVMAADDPAEVEKVLEMINTNSMIKSNAGESEGSGSVRAVAKKTVTRLNDSPRIISTKASYHHHTRSGKDEFAGFIKVVKDLGMPILFPRDLGVHECSEACIQWTNRTLDMCRGKNPLAMPMLFAFRRVDVCHMGSGSRQIFYESPCGIRLEDYEQLLAYLQKTKSLLSVDHFIFEPWVSVWDEFKATAEGLVLKDLSYGKEFNPIPVVNTVDRDLPPYLNYMVLRKATDGVPLNLDTDFLICCDCTDDCSDKSKCPCWQKTLKDYFDLIVKSNIESEINTEAGNIDYSYIGYQNKRLVEYVPSGIYECNSMCKCQHTCLNRVVQLPLKVKLELFKTKYKGWGTRCLNDIPAGGFICVYVGNILTEKAANEGGKTHGDEYFAELDYIEVMERLMNKPGYESGPSDPENSDEDDSGTGDQIGLNRSVKCNSKEKESKMRLKRSTTDQGRLRGLESKSPAGPGTGLPENSTSADTSTDVYIPLRTLYGNNESVYIIDAKTAGNVGRYFNHSCEPNIFVQNVFVDTHDLRFPWVAFFAKQHIRAGTELTWDYQYMVDSVPGKKLYCYCGTSTCRGRLL